MAITFPTIFQSAIATDPAATALGYLTPTRYNAGVAIAGLSATSGAVLYSTSATVLAQSSGFTWNTTGAAGEGLAIAAGTAVGAGVAAFSLTRTNNNAAVDTGVLWTYTDTTSAAGFLPFQILGTSTGAVNLFNVAKTGVTTVGDKLILNKATTFTNNLFADFQNNGTSFAQIKDTGLFYSQPGDINNAAFGSKNNANFGMAFIGSPLGTALLCGSGGVGISALTSGAVVFNGGGAAGGAASRLEINKLVTGISDNSATATFTVTIPNGAHSAGGTFSLKGAAGAGGAIGADEFSAFIEYEWVVTRTAGVNAVATLSAAVATATTASVAGGATPTISAALSAIAGAVGATNTFTVNVTIHAITGASTNHTCFCYGVVINDNASGVTIA